MFWKKLLSKGDTLSQDITYSSSAGESTGSRWRDNHGNLLMLFVALVFLIGAGFLIYRQNRFVAPRFPESDMITPPSRVSELASVSADNSVTVRVIGAANDNGSVKIVIYDSASAFDNPSNALISEAVLIQNGEAIWKIPVKLPDRFSISAFHDENNDSELNRNRLDVPTERYGYSGNVRSATGVPSYKEAVIARPKPGESINVFIR